MAFVFSTSHLPETRVRRPDHLEEEEDDEDSMSPPPRAGMVRAFSHLPAKEETVDRTGPLSQRGAQAIGRQPQRTEEPEDTSRAQADGIAAAKASGVFDAVRQQYNSTGSPHYMNEDGNLRLRDEARLQGAADAPPQPASHAPDDTISWHRPPVTRQNLRSLGFDEGSLGSPATLAGSPLLNDLVSRPRGGSTPGPLLNDLVNRYNGSPEDAKKQNWSLHQNAASTQYLAQAKTGARQTPLDSPARQSKGAAAPPAQGRASTPSVQGGGARRQNPGAVTAPQGAGSLAKYRQQKQKALEELANAAPGTASRIKNRIAAITRNMESIELAAHLINHTRQKGEAALDPESIDEDSAEFKNRARTAIHRLHGGSAPWMDHLAANFGEREGTPGGGQNPPIKDLFKRVGVGKKNTNIEPWCGHALNDAMTQAGIKAPNGAGLADTWHKWGNESGQAAGGISVGDVYHIRYPNPPGTPPGEAHKGHVATVVGVSKDGTQVFCLGGNQNGGLNISAYPISLFKGAEVVYRKPSGQHNNIPAPTFDYHADEDMFSILSGLTR